MSIKQETVDALMKSSNIKEAATELKISYNTMTNRCRRYGLTGFYEEMHKQQIVEAINNHPNSMLHAAESINLPYHTFVYRAKKFDLYTPNQGGLKSERRTIRDNNSKIPLEDILAGKYPNYYRCNLKSRMLKEGLLENICDECGVGPTWNGKPIVIELDHINGINDDHRKENLRMLCPNCHSQTKTFKGRNKNKYMPE